MLNSIVDQMFTCRIPLIYTIFIIVMQFGENFQ